MMRNLLIFTSFLLMSCQLWSTRQDEFNQVHVGMTKPEVIKVLGSPSWSDRKDNEDRWIYFLDSHDRTSERLVYFKQGLVSRKGLRDKPSLSAEEMEALKKERLRSYTHKPSVSEKELRRIIKKEIEKKEGSQKENFEKL